MVDIKYSPQIMHIWERASDPSTGSFKPVILFFFF